MNIAALLEPFEKYDPKTRTLYVSADELPPELLDRLKRLGLKPDATGTIVTGRVCIARPYLPGRAKDRVIAAASHVDATVFDTIQKAAGKQIWKMLACIDDLHLLRQEDWAELMAMCDQLVESDTSPADIRAAIVRQTTRMLRWKRSASDRRDERPETSDVQDMRTGRIRPVPRTDDHEIDF